jgi:hypothetical protein
MRVNRSWDMLSNALAMAVQVVMLVKYSKALRYIHSGSGIESHLPSESLCLFLCGLPCLRNSCEVQAHLTNVDLATLAPLTDGYHYREVSSSFGGVEQRWLVVYSEARQQRGQRTVDKQLAKQSDTARKAFKQLCAKTFACAADARQALEPFKAT